MRLVVLDHALEGSIRDVVESRAQQKERRECTRQPPIAILERVDGKEIHDAASDHYQRMKRAILKRRVRRLDEVAQSGAACQTASRS